MVFSKLILYENIYAWFVFEEHFDDFILIASSLLVNLNVFFYIVQRPV